MNKDGITMQNLNLLIQQLTSLPTETEWLEFKHNNFDPAMIASDISALANSAAYRGKDKAYMIWGVHNETHEILGTEYNRFSKLVNNQEIGSWLKNMLSKNAGFDFFDTDFEKPSHSQSLSKKILTSVLGVTQSL